MAAGCVVEHLGPPISRIGVFLKGFLWQGCLANLSGPED
jgi:hypothetical protein